MRRELHTVIVAYHGRRGSRSLPGRARAHRQVTVVDNSSSTEVRDVASRHGAEYVDAGREHRLRCRGRISRCAGSSRARRATCCCSTPTRASRQRRPRPRSLFPARAGTRRVASVAPRLVDGDGDEQRVSWPFPSPIRTWMEAVGPRGRSWPRGLRHRSRAAPTVGGVPAGRRASTSASSSTREETDWQRRAAQLGWCARALPRRGRRARRRRLERRPAPPRSALPRRPGDLHTEVARPSRLVGLPSRCVRRSDRESRAAQRRSPGRGRAPGPPLRARPTALRRPGTGLAMPSVVHVVTTANFAGVERYVSDVASETAGRGWDATVVGGDPTVCRRHSADARAGSRARRRSGAALTARVGRQDVCHAHMTLAEAVSGTRRSSRTRRQRPATSPHGEAQPCRRLLRPWIARALHDRSR